MYKNWTHIDLLSLTYIKGLSPKDIFFAVDNYEDLNDWKTSLHFKKFKDVFSIKDMFDFEISSCLEQSKRQFEVCQKKNVNLVSFWDNNYPELLKQIVSPPILLFVKGKLAESDAMSLSIVGTRKCSFYGKNQAINFAEFFAKNGIIVTSGLAYGIDTEAHLSAVRNNGITYAIIASGIDCISPQIAQKNAEKIVESGGAIISAYHCGVKAHPQFFLQRNRLISGISQATLIVESDKKGGSLWTAKFALDQEREVYAIPGNIDAPKSLGTNYLIKQQLAAPALSGQQLFEDARYGKATVLFEKTNVDDFSLNPNEISVLESINNNPTHVDSLLEISKLEISELLVILLNLEFNDLIKQLPGKYYIRNTKV